MSDVNGSSSVWDRLRRHPAVQAGLVYLGAGWALIQAADVLLPGSGVVRWLGLALAAGFVAVVGVTWRLAVVESRPAAEWKRVAPAEPGAHRRRRRLAYGSAVALLALGGVLWWIRPSIVGAVPADAQVIAVLPFTTSGIGTEELGEGMIDLLSTNLDGVGGIRTVSSRTVVHRWRQRAGEGALDLEGALAVGRDVGAGSILLGNVVAAGSEVRLTAELYSVSDGLMARARADGNADSVLSLVDSLSLHLLREIWLARKPVPNLRVSSITTASSDAIRAYLEGLRQYRRLEFDSAVVALERAVDLDSAFALAEYELANAYAWSTRHGVGYSRSRLEAAVRHADRLPPRERSLFAGRLLHEEGDLAALDTMEAFVARYPDDPDGWLWQADTRFHAQPVKGFDPDQLYAGFDRALELDPSSAVAAYHPLELALVNDDSARYRHYLSVYEAVADSALVEPWRLAATLWTQPDSLPFTVADLWEFSPGVLSGYYVQALYRWAPLPPDSLLALFERMASSGPEAARFVRLGFPPEPDPRLLWWRAVCLTSLGRLAEAAPVLDSLNHFAEDEAAQIGLTAFIAGYADSTFAGGYLRGLADGAESGREAEQMGDYYRMLVALRRGDALAARRYAAEVQAAAISPYSGQLAQLARAGEGWAALLDGDTVGGLALLEIGFGRVSYDFPAISIVGAPLRFVWAATLAARPETRERGMRLLRYGQWLHDLQYVPISYMVLGRALEDAGDRAGAARAYARFIHLWEGADPELQPRVEAARRALERLAAEGTLRRREGA